MSFLSSPMPPSSSFTKFTQLVNNMNRKESIIRKNTNEVIDLEGQNNSGRLQLISYHYQYFYLFILAFILILFIFRMMTSDTSKIDNIILIIIAVFLVHHFFYKYF